MSHPWIQLLAATALCVPLLVPSAALAESAARARTTSLVQSLTAKPEYQASVSDLLARARRALQRADATHAAGDHRRATELEAYALELAEAANDLVRALDAEREVADLSRRALAAETRAVRARVLVEQTAARRGRAAAQLSALEAERNRNANTQGTPAKAAPATTTERPR